MRALGLHEALVYGQGMERPFLCPVHGDTRPSASVNVAKGVWYCYTCGARGGLTGEDALIEPDYLQMKIWFEKKMEEGRVYPESWLQRWTTESVHPYWTERGFSPEAVRHFRLGWDPERGSATYPLRDPAGAVLGVVRRNLQDDGGPKYLYPEGIDIGRLLFNYSPGVRRSVVLVEGALDAIAAWDAGVDAFAVYGSHLSDSQAALIYRCEPEVIYTAYDNDEAGFRAHVETDRAFPDVRVVRLTWGRAWGKDIADLTKNRRKFVFSDVVSDDLSCVESASCRSPESTETRSRLRILSSKST